MYRYPRGVRSPLALALLLTLAACAGRSESGPRESALASRTPSPAPRAERYVAVGASDTVGVGATDPRAGSWPARIAPRLPEGSTYTNLGVSGSLAAQARVEQSAAAVAARPTLVTVWLAVNDLNAGLGAAAYRDALDGLVSELVARTEARIFVGNVPELWAVPVYRGADATVLRAQVAAYNRSIAEIAAKHPGRVIVVDLLTGSAELVSTATVSADGFHPSDRGYELIAERFIAAMRAAGIRLRE